MRLAGAGRAARPRLRDVAFAIAIRRLHLIGQTLASQKIFRPFLCATIGLGLAWIVAGHVANATGYAASNGSAIIASRSPGARGNGILVQTKSPKQRIASRSGNRNTPHPHQRVLSEIRDHRPALTGPPIFIIGDSPGLLPVTPAMISFASPVPAQLPSIFEEAALNSPVLLLQPGGVSTSPSGPATSVTPAASVPEPDTWAMMIIGISMIGIVIRRRRRRTRMPFAV